jgi:hypothetical protein
VNVPEDPDLNSSILLLSLDKIKEWNSQIVHVLVSFLTPSGQIADHSILDFFPALLFQHN